MKITITKKPLQKITETAQRIADRKNPMPIMSCVVLHAGDGGLSAAATSLELVTSSRAECVVHASGSVCVNAKTLFDIVKNLPDGDIVVSVGKNHAMELRAGKAKFKIPGMPAEDFPTLPDFAGVYEPVPAAALRRLIEGTRASVSSDDTRPHLAALRLFASERDGDVTRELTAVSTDGHRLTRVEVQVACAAAPDALIPARMLGELLDLCGAGSDVGVGVRNGWLFAGVDGHTVACKLCDDQFPPWQKVIPSDRGEPCHVDRHALLNAVKRAALMARDKSGGIKVLLEADKLTIQAENPDAGESAEDLEATYSGPALAFGINARYLAEALASVVEDVAVLQTKGELDPVVVSGGEGGDALVACMPMRI